MVSVDDQGAVVSPPLQIKRPQHIGKKSRNKNNKSVSQKTSMEWWKIYRKKFRAERLGSVVSWLCAFYSNSHYPPCPCEKLLSTKVTADPFERSNLKKKLNVFNALWCVEKKNKMRKEIVRVCVFFFYRKPEFMGSTDRSKGNFDALKPVPIVSTSFKVHSLEL